MRRARARRLPGAAAGSSCRCLRGGVEEPDSPEPGCRTAVAERCGLTGRALAAVERAPQQVGLRPADGVHRAPEVCRRRLIGDITELPGDLSGADAEEALTGELEVVTLHVDRPGLVTEDV